MSKLQNAHDKLAEIKEHVNETQIMVEGTQELLDEIVTALQEAGTGSAVEQVSAMKSRLEELDASLIEAGQHADDITVDLNGMISG